MLDVGVIYTDGSLSTTDTSRAASTKIYVSPGDNINITGDYDSSYWSFVVYYNDADEKLSHSSISTNITIPENTSYIRLGIYKPTHMTVANNDNGKILFDWSQ